MRRRNSQSENKYDLAHNRGDRANPQHKQAHTPIRRNGDHDHRSSDCTIELTGLYIKCRDRRVQISEIARQQTLSRYAFACIPVPGAQASLSLFLRSVLARALEPWAAQARAAAKDGESSFLAASLLWLRQGANVIFQRYT